MRKIQLLMFAAFAVFAFSAMASVAYGEDDFLVDGQLATTQEWLYEGEFTLTDLTSLGSGTLLCSWLLHGHFEGSKDMLVTELLSLEDVLISSTPLSGTGLSCTGDNLCAGSPNLAEIWPENLPWLAEIVLDGTTFLLHLTGDGSGEPAYHYVCKNILGGSTEDLCEGLIDGPLENMAAEEDVLVNFVDEEAGKELGTCNSTSGGKTGHVSGFELLFVTGKASSVS